MLPEPYFECEELLDPLFTAKGIRLLVARLDRIHPVISGNKLFKLHYFIEAAVQSACRTILTFGGAYSNHLLATACSCNKLALKSIGIVRGEQPSSLSHTLKSCLGYGMQLEFVSRETYAQKEDPAFIHSLENQFGPHVVVPEGGYHPLGMMGASLILGPLLSFKPTHICTAVGSATTLAGLIKSAPGDMEIIAVPVIKGMTDLTKRLDFLFEEKTHLSPVIFSGYEFGGYAKNTPALIRFMNDLYTQFKLPTDFVYTGKMMHAMLDKINSNYFPMGSTIICLHTGGLQGNESLTPGRLVF